MQDARLFALQLGNILLRPQPAAEQLVDGRYRALIGDNRIPCVVDDVSECIPPGQVGANATGFGEEAREV